MEDITSEERLKVERTIWSTNLVTWLSDYDKDSQNAAMSSQDNEVNTPSYTA
jgi:uncharacterized protein YccT (UPF0319 family)